LKPRKHPPGVFAGNRLSGNNLQKRLNCSLFAFNCSLINGKYPKNSEQLKADSEQVESRFPDFLDFFCKAGIKYFL
jgi:hypothetical protein